MPYRGLSVASAQGPSVDHLITRLLGLILCAMAVQFIISGIAGSTHNLVRRDAVTPYASDK